MIKKTKKFFEDVQFEMKKVSWFVLPPVQEWYYRKTHPSYRVLPPYKTGCNPMDERNIMEFIYPKPGIKVFVPRGTSGKKEKVIFQVSHQNPNIKLYWNLDNLYLGSTQGTHQMAFVPEPGHHTLVVVDENGISKKIRFEVVE